MGGNRPKQPSAIISFDSIANGNIESDPWWQNQAILNGWKLRSGFAPESTPVFHRTRGWLMLDDTFGSRQATLDEVRDFQARLGVMGA